MLKKTLFFSNAYHLSITLQQLQLSNKQTGEIRKVPVEDLGFVVLDHPEITLTQAVIQELSVNNVAVVFCDKKHHPTSMLFHLDGHQIQNERFRAQVAVKLPLKKQLWQQTIQAKILNQAKVLFDISENNTPLIQMAKDVKSDDSSGREAKAAKYYWRQLFGDHFRRERYGMPPNPSLNYGYAILRAAVARGLVGSGLLPTLGIHHHNKYNAYCLADDIMEPYRPFVDKAVYEMMQTRPDYHIINTETKRQMLSILSSDVKIGTLKRPLMVAISQTTASLAQCFEGKQTQIKYPKFCI